MKAREAIAPTGSDAPSEYWSDALGSIEYMLDASPLVVEKLRHHTDNVTGIVARSYRAHRDRDRVRHRLKLEALHRTGRPELLVPESPILGGFGFDADGS